AEVAGDHCQPDLGGELVEQRPRRRRVEAHQHERTLFVLPEVEQQGGRSDRSRPGRRVCGSTSLPTGPARVPRTRCAVPGVRQDGAKGSVMSWVVLVISGVLEAVWATALGRSEGFSRLVPTVVFAVALLASMSGLAYAMRELPTG